MTVQARDRDDGGRPVPTVASSPSGGANSVVLGIGCAVVAYLFFSVQDATFKWLVNDLPAPEMLFMRSAVIVPLCIVCGGPRVAVRAVISPVRGQLLWRSLVLVGAWLSYYTAAPHLQLAELTTIYFSSPLLVGVLAFPLLKERVTWSRCASLAIGFAGVLIAVRPGDLHDPGPVGLALLAAALWAYTTILIRQVVKAESSLVLLLVSNLAILCVCGAMMPFLWQAMSARQLALGLMASLFGAAGQFMSMEGIRRAPAIVVAPISFSSLVWAFVFGLIVWGDVPAPPVFIGAGLIILSGLVIAASEWRAIRRLARAQ